MCVRRRRRSSCLSTQRPQEAPLASEATPTLVEGHIATGDKGLKANALGFMSNLVRGVAWTRPAFSLAATLGFITIINGVGVKAPAVLIVSFVPIFLVARSEEHTSELQSHLNLVC